MVGQWTRNQRLRCGCAIAGYALCGVTTWAQPNGAVPRPSARATKVATAPEVDGRVIDDPVWQSIVPLTDFWQVAPRAGEPASERTEVRVVYTSDTVYFGVVCFDRTPGAIILSDTRRDSSLADNDSFRIILDTYRDGQNGFVFGTTPAGVEYDGQVTLEGVAVNPGPGGGGGGGGGGGRQQAGSGGGFNLNWDGSWRVRTSSGETGWSAEFAIPLRTLRYMPGASQTWGVNFERTIRRRKETAFWAPLPIQFDLYRVSQAGTLTALDIPMQRSLKLVPYALAQSNTFGRRGQATRGRGDVGGDLKFSITPGLTLDATVNTDFAQVEVDDQQINLDRFNLLFPEKRPFFLENAGLFAVGSPGEAEVFFSRRIGISQTGEAIPIMGGARLSGRVGSMNVGLLNMQTEAGVGRGPSTNFTVGRIRRDLPNRSNVGLIYVGKEGMGDLARTSDHNRAFAADGRMGIGRTGLVTGFVARTTTPGRSRGQHAYQIQARNETQPLTLSAGYTETGEDFNPEVGFLSRVGGFRKIEVAFNSRLRSKSRKVFQELRPHSQYRLFYDHTGFWQTGYWHIDNHWEFKNRWEVHTGVNVTHEGVTRAFQIVPGVTVPTGSYDHKEAQLVLVTDDSRVVSARTQVNVGGAFGGDRVTLTQSARVRAGQAFTSEVSWVRNDYTLPLGDFVTNLTRARVSYAFSPNVFVQALLQHNDRDRVWSSNYRFSWLQQANTGLFVVYTDTHPFDDLTDRFGPRFGPDRSVTIKFSRMFDALD